jgi:hypothetical protein
LRSRLPSVLILLSRDRLLNQEVAQKFFQRVLQQAQAYLSDEYLPVDGTVIEAWASQKSFQNTCYSPTLYQARLD